MQKQSQATLDNFTKSYEAFSKGFQDLGKESMSYTKKQTEASSAAFEKMVASKSIEKAVEVQTDYAKDAFEGFVAQATKMNELYMDVAKKAYAPFEKAVAAPAK